MLIFRDYNVFYDKKLFNIFLGLCIYFLPKPVKMILENHSLKRFWTAYDMLCYLVFITLPLICMTWFYTDVSATKLIMKYQLVLQVFYSVISVYIFDVLPLWKINFYITAFEWVRINNKCGFRLANRFEQREFLKFFITKDN